LLIGDGGGLGTKSVPPKKALLAYSPSLSKVFTNLALTSQMSATATAEVTALNVDSRGSVDPETSPSGPEY
jgi:hypothetical protein